jgi:hypothetical protein
MGSMSSQDRRQQQEEDKEEDDAAGEGLEPVLVRGRK